MKVGLVLEGGGMRGLYTAGVLDMMMEQPFMPLVCKMHKSNGRHWKDI